MNIVCPNCTTSFAIDAAKLGPAGRSVRCARCKQIWLARPEQPARGDILTPTLAPDVRSASTAPALASVGGATAGADHETLEWNDAAASDAHPGAETPVIDSPSIATDWPVSGHDEGPAHDSAATTDRTPGPPPPRQPWLRWRSNRRHGPPRPRLTLPMACLGMAAMVFALIVWRADVVRLLPQTDQFYRFFGFDVNLRGLAFKDVRVTTETVDNKPVLVIEGNIVDVGRTPVELPRLRFIVRDAKGAEIYAWNAVLEQPILKPGEQAWFRSRLAAPPPQGHNIEVRFFNRHDLATGGI